MPAKNTSNTSELDTFRRFLEAADRVALELIIRDGILCDAREEHRSDYYVALTELAQEFSGPYQTTEIDDVVHMEEYQAKLVAAQMIGLAMGLRLRGVSFDVQTEGGAR